MSDGGRVHSRIQGRSQEGGGLFSARDRNNDRPEPQNEHAENLWGELTSLKTMTGLKNFWEDNSSDIKMMGPNVLKKFSAEKDRLKSVFEAQASTLNAG